jgi:hypothetical protein
VIEAAPDGSCAGAAAGFQPASRPERPAPAADWRLIEMNLNVLVLPGDGIGTEVTREAVRVLRHVAGKMESQLHIAKDCWAASRFTRPARRFPDETARWRPKPTPR